MSNHNDKRRLFSRPTPWWLSVIMATASYCGLKYIIPAIRLEDATLLKFTKAAPSLAPLVAIAFLLLAAKKLYDKDQADTGQGPTEKDEEDPGG